MKNPRFKLAAAACAAALCLPPAASATPITYEFYLVTSGSLGSWSFDNALVHFVTQSDTATARFFQSFGGQSSIWLNTAGTTTVSIMAQGRSVRAKFPDGLLFVSIDQAGGGVGLGSCVDATSNAQTPCGDLSSPNVVPLPAYPIGIQDGIPDCIIGDIDCVKPSDAMLALPVTLDASTMMSGRAWCDPGFATPNEGTDGGPLPTNFGAFVIKRPFERTSFPDPLVTGIFRATLHPH